MRYEHESRTTEMLRLIREIQDDTAKALAASEQVGATCDRYRRALEEIVDLAPMNGGVRGLIDVKWIARKALGGTDSAARSCFDE